MEVSRKMNSLEEGTGKLATPETIKVEVKEEEGIAMELVTAKVSVAVGLVVRTVSVNVGVNVDMGDTSTENVMWNTDGVGEDVKLLKDIVNSEEDMGMSMSSEDVCTTELGVTVGSGMRSIEVGGGGSSVDKLSVGVDSTKIDEVVSGKSIPELPPDIDGEICGILVNCDEKLREVDVEISGMSNPELPSGIRIEGVGSGAISEVVSLNDILGVGRINVEVSGKSITELASGMNEDIVGNGDTRELVGLKDALGDIRTDVNTFGISTLEVLSGMNDEILTSKLLGVSDKLRENVERDTVDEGKSSILDRTVNEREGMVEEVGKTDSVRISRDVTRDCTENIADITGIDVSESSRSGDEVVCDTGNDAEGATVTDSDNGSRTGVGSDEGITLFEGIIS